ncbi:GNAT family N-acetyltransferase (plasmid) [Skermanella rosea]|uniref:GNAT family N-acetyltransferase n=1 Tax=Skermanella rosea TaxID=1817965 RepID=UPI0019321844|nr:GNAT family protein [Skermanella rosea]UEM07396.1 GNAT family N-acetyltransferase [Skermanella rosea]
MDLSGWNGAPRPERIVIEGSYARLEPLDPARHGAQLFRSARQDGAEDRFRYLFEEVPADEESFARWLKGAAASQDPLFFAVIDKTTGRAEGRQALMRIDPTHGVIEIGNILWGPAISRTRVATEAFFLFATHAFDTLGYRRFEWKCNDRNAPSKRAAERFGFTFEGVFRNHMVVKGENRDTAWFSIVDSEWPALRTRFKAWLDPSNFDGAGNQKRRLGELPT